VHSGRVAAEAEEAAEASREFNGQPAAADDAEDRPRATRARVPRPPIRGGIDTSRSGTRAAMGQDQQWFDRRRLFLGRMI